MATAATLTLTAQLLTVSMISLQRQIYHNRGLNRTTWNDSYDFIVVGAGTAGSVVAARLSENPNVNVLLLEYGPPVQTLNDPLSMFYFLQQVHTYKTVPQRNSAFGMNQRRTTAARGRVLGGSGTVNNALYTRGNRRDFDSWGSYYGAEGWSYEQVLPYFLRSENNTDPAVVAANPSYHSTGGPLQVSSVANPDPLYLHWNRANVLNGYPNTDVNGPNQFGTMIMQATQHLNNRTRGSGATAFLEPNILRPNLHVLVNTLATRILFRPGADGTPMATGVEFSRNNQTYTVSASREVIVSGGAFQSPQLLMLSGIGPRWHLDQLGIPVVTDLPVGEGLQDHVMSPLDFLATNQSDIQWTRNIYDQLSVENMYQFFAQATGPMSQLPVSETYIPTGINGDRDWPDMQCYMLINQYADNVDDVLPIFDQSNADAWRAYLLQITGNQRHFFISPTLYRARTTGTVRLATRSAADDPLIDPDYFNDRNDLMAMVRGMSMCLKIVESDAFRPYSRYVEHGLPGCKLCRDRPLSECYTYLACAIQTYTINSFHPCCTTRMGNASNPLAVVDARLRVLGVQRLRVVDASVMPVVPNANINAATFMLGERGSDLIRADNQLG